MNLPCIKNSCRPEHYLSKYKIQSIHPQRGEMLFAWTSYILWGGGLIFVWRILKYWKGISIFFQAKHRSRGKQWGNMLLARYFPLHLFAIQYLLNFVCFQAGNEAPVILSCSRSATWGWEYGCKMKYFPICFLFLMTCLVRVENVPIPGDCTTKPYQEKGGKNENQDGRLHLDCTLSAINSESEKTNFSVIPGEHTASLTVRCSDTLSTSHLEPQGKLFF